MIKITKATCSDLRKDMEKDLKMMAEKYGLKIKVGNARYTESNVRFDVILSVVDESGVAKTPQLTALEKLYPQYMNKEINWLGKKYVIVGYETKSWKFPFQMKNLADGKIYKCSLDQIKMVLK